MTLSTKAISATNYKGETIELSRDEYLNTWQSAGIDSIKGLIAYSREFSVNHLDRINAIERELKALAIDVAGADFDQKAHEIKPTIKAIEAPTITAINPAHQKTVNKYLIADRKHVDLSDSFDRQLDSAETDKQIDRLENKKERQTDKTYQRCYDLFSELPARERQNIDKQYAAHYGYGCQMGAN